MTFTQIHRAAAPVASTPDLREAPCPRGSAGREEVFVNLHTALPPITVTSDDYSRLMMTAMVSRELGNPHAEFLLSELRRATLCHPEDLPTDVVSLDSRVTYRVDGAPLRRTRLLVHPENLVWPGAEVGATTPLGIALLGLRPGDRMRFPGTGRTREVLVEAVGLGLHELGTLGGIGPTHPDRCKRPTYELH
jgi:regulator of nucleoside diphosphate kinase